MTILQWSMFGLGTTVWLGLGFALFLTAWLVYHGKESVSGYLKNAPRWVVAAVAFGFGMAMGLLGAHWWWPTSNG